MNKKETKILKTKKQVKAVEETPTPEITPTPTPIVMVEKEIKTLSEPAYDSSIATKKGDKIQVQILKDGKVISVRNYKSIKEFSKQCENIEYYILRIINEISDKRLIKKFTHIKMTEILKQIRIFTIPFIVNLN